MRLFIDDSNQQQINQLRIDLAQATMDLSEVHTTDFNSRQAKEKSFESLRKVKNALDHLGLKHSAAQRCANGRA